MKLFLRGTTSFSSFKNRPSSMRRKLMSRSRLLEVVSTRTAVRAYLDFFNITIQGIMSAQLRSLLILFPAAHHTLSHLIPKLIHASTPVILATPSISASQPTESFSRNSSPRQNRWLGSSKTIKMGTARRSNLASRLKRSWIEREQKSL